MSLKRRLFLTFGGITLLVLAPALFALSSLREVRNIAFEQRRSHAVALEALGQLQADLAEFDRYERSFVAAPGDGLRRGMQTSLSNARDDLDRIRGAGYDETTRTVAVDLDSLAASAGAITSMISAGHVEQATATLVGAARTRLHRTQDDLKPVAQAIDRRSLREVTTAQDITSSATTGTAVVAAVAFLLALILGGVTLRALTGPLRRLRDATREIADGHFDVPAPLPYERQDEIGEVSRSFRSMTRRLAELERLKAEFLSVASHELKTPINVIGGYVELLTEGIYGPITDGQSEVLGRIQEQAESLTRQVSELLDLSRIEAGGLVLHPVSFELADMMSALRRTFEPLAEQKQIRFSADVAPDAPHRITADPDLLRNELIGNLLSNAFKFTPEGGSVAVSVQPGRDGRVRIEVADTGSGIPADQLPFIFDKYYQVGREARRKGSGLGLAIAREIAQAHGGDLSVESEAGRGTTFRIDLPVPAEADAAQADAADTA